MFLYRLTTSNRFRLLFAVFLAITLHAVLMNIKFSPKAVSAPSVSMPRSVSVFLNQREIVATPVEVKNKSQKAEPILEKQAAAKTEPIKSVSPEMPAAEIKNEKQLKQPVLPENSVNKSADETIFPATQPPEELKKDLLTGSGSGTKVKEIFTQPEPMAAEENDGAILPGTLQMAYPRYQLNTPPAYPALARKRKQEGTVVLQVLVNKMGRVHDLKIETSSGYRLLDRAAVIAVQKWIFEPGQQGEEKLDMWVKVPVTFQLK